LDYIGVNYDHNPSGPGQIFLILLADDGTQQIKTSIPLEGAPAMSINDYGVVPLGESYRGVFETESVGSYFNMVILAYHRIQQGPSYLSFIGLLADLLLGTGGVGQSIGSAIDQINSQAPQYEYVGSYQARWNDNNSWGIGQYNTVGDDDLRLWFRIWSDSPQQPVSNPTLSPDVIIQSVDVPSQVEVGKTYTYPITLRNNESHSVTVTLKIHSSVTGDVSPQSVTVPAYGTQVVQDTTKFQPIGIRTVTYSILYNGEVIHSVSKTVEATPLSISFLGWYVQGIRIDSSTKGQTVTAKLSLSGGGSGEYIMRIRRDISWSSDEDIQALSFYYDGISATKEMSFVPPYATNEASTNGYFIYLVRSGTIIWEQLNTYPPRLRVN
jgi:hypothetical protein